MSNADYLPNPSGIKIEHNKLSALETGSAKEPAISLGGEHSSGWYLNNSGEVVFTSYGEDNIIQNYDYTEFKRSLMFNDDPTINPVQELTRGLLYKKVGSPGLWWKTTNTDVNLATGGFPDPVKLLSGGAAAPTYSFAADDKTGVYLQNKGQLGLTASGVESMRITKNFIKAYNPIEILDTSRLDPPETAISGYLYKKPGNDNLWWKTAAADINITDKLPEVFKSLNGSAGAPVYSFATNTASGLFLVASGDIGVSINGLLKTEFKQSETSSQVPIKVPNGSVFQPAYSFNNSANTGMYLSIPGKVGFTVSGTQALEIDNELVKSIVPMSVTDGAIDDLSLKFSSDKSTGLFKPAAGNMALVTGKSEIVRLNTSGLEVKTGTLKATDGSIQAPSYSFTSNNQSGMYYTSDFVGIATDGANLVKFKKDSIETHKPNRAANSFTSVPQYSFVESPSSGLSHESRTNTLALSVAGADGLLSLNAAKVKITCPIEIGETSVGRLYKKPNSPGLWWKAGNVDVDLSDKNTSAVPDILLLTSGTCERPSYSFAADVNTGFYHKSDGCVGFASGSTVLMSMGPETIDFHNTPIVLGDRAVYSSGNVTSGALYKKKNSTGLFWNVNGVEVDVLDKTVSYPLAASNGSENAPVYSFASDTNTGMFRNNSDSLGFSTAGVSRMTIDQRKVTLEQPLEIKESVPSAPTDSTYGRLYKESGTGHLIWNSSLGQVHLTKNLTKYTAIPSGNISSPDFNFTTDTDTGMYLAANGVLGFVTGGAMSLAVSESQTIIYNTIVVKDTAQSTPAITGEGHLYKKNGSTGLFWSTIVGNEVDLTQVRFPFAATDGSSMVPVYAFASEPGTGMYRNSSGGVGISVAGTTQLLINSNVASFGKPIEIKEQVASTGVAGAGRLYKKIGSDALCWNVNGIETDISSGIKYPIKADDGSQLAPVYSFASESSLGISRTSAGVISVVNNSAVISSFNSNQVAIVPKLALSAPMQLAGLNGTYEADANSGILYKKVGSNGLFWKADLANEVDLTSTGTSFDGGVVHNPVLVPVGSAVGPAIAFTSASRTGIYHHGTGDNQAVCITVNGTNSTSIGSKSILAPGGTPAEPSYSFTKNNNTGMYITDGPGVVLGLSAGGSAGITISPTGVTLQKRIKIKDTNEAGTEVSTGSGELYKVAGDKALYWKPAGDDAIALGGDVTFPITAPRGTSAAPSYAFADSPNTGLYLDETGRPTVSRSSVQCAVFDNGRIFSASTGTVLNPTYSFVENETCGTVLTTSNNVKYLSTVLNSVSCLDVHEDQVTSVNPFVSMCPGDATAASVAVAGINSSAAGLYKVSDTELGVTTGKTEAIKIDEASLTVSRTIVVKPTSEPVPVVGAGSLYKKADNENLYWKTSKGNVSLTNTNCVELTAGDNLTAGSVVGFDVDGTKIVKSIGGLSRSVQSTGTSIIARASIQTLTYSVFSTVAGESLALTLSQAYAGNNKTNISVNAVWINDSTMTSVASKSVVGLVVPGNLPECHCSIVEIDAVSKWYVVSAVVESGDVIYFRKVRLATNHTIQSDDSGIQCVKTLPGSCIAYDTTYDKAVDMLICIAYLPVNMNFTAVLIQANSGSGAALNLNGTVDTCVSSEMISDSNKQLHVVSLPGQVAVVSYGNHKVSFIAMSYDSPITQGETMIDYDSCDCVDMHFDDIENMLICLEKTITPSCFVQAIDIIGTKMQRVATKNFKNQTMEPFGVAYNNTTGNYTMLYGSASNAATMYYTVFTFDGDEFTIGMRYSIGGSLYVESNNFRKGKSVFSLSNRCVLGIWPNGGDTVLDINCFTDGYSSYPSAFIGIVTDNVAVNDIASVAIRGSVYTGHVNMNPAWTGKKLYLADYYAAFPGNLSTSALGNAFIGTCIGVNKILLGI